MLKISKQKDYALHHEKVEALLDLLSIYQQFDLAAEKHSKSHFIIAESDEKGVYGGALLYPQEIAPHFLPIATDTNEEKIIKLTSAFQTEENAYWTARICLCLEMPRSVTDILPAQGICYRFYKELYLDFKKFGEEERIDFLAYTLWNGETYSMKTYEYWPYRLDIVLADPDHDFNHGLLSLKGKRFKTRQYDKSWRQS